MAKYLISLVTDAPSAAEAVARVTVNSYGQYIGEWLDISVSALDD